MPIGALLRSSPADLVILDWSMPGMGGLEVLTTMRSDPQLARVPVVIYSANVEPANIEIARAAGAEAFVPKNGRSFNDLCRAAERFDRH